MTQLRLWTFEDNSRFAAARLWNSLYNSTSLLLHLSTNSAVVI